ncbi:MAG: glycosyltransferase [Luteolibacter sp.]
MSLDGPGWIDLVARCVSRWVLDEPFASIAVSDTSQRDLLAVGSQKQYVIYNGIEDPCPDFDSKVLPLIRANHEKIRISDTPCFRILFLSHGTEEKGILDAVECLRIALDTSDPAWRFQITFAGGISESTRCEFDRVTKSILNKWPDRITVIEKGYLTGDKKYECFNNNDIFLAPSRWESFGLTVVEAMSFGMQIVATSSDGVRGVLPQDHSYLSPVGDPRSLSENLLMCCGSIRQQPQIDRAFLVRERFLSIYQIDGYSENIVTTFGGMAGRPRQVRALDKPRKEITEDRRRRLRIQIYLADQNPGHDRSFGISRMSQVVMAALKKTDEIDVHAITSQTSQQPPEDIECQILPWGTRNKFVRLLTDHFHPLFESSEKAPDIHYFPKGYLPWISQFSKPSVVTIHDTIIQYDEDHYPKWRKSKDYAYWAWMLKFTLRDADLILTVSESSKEQIRRFMTRHRIPEKEITVTYEPCLYEEIPQPMNPGKKDYVIHLASREPHKRTAQLVKWWLEAEQNGKHLPTLHLIGTLPAEVSPLLASSQTLVRRPFLEDAALRDAYTCARALILPSEIEGFGLPALEAYYLGTPVCHVAETSVGEILSVATSKGRFSLDNPESLFKALDEVTAMSPEEIYQCGLDLRTAYASDQVAHKMIQAFQGLVAER